MVFEQTDTAGIRPAGLSDALWHTLTNRRLLAMYGLTFILAVAIPLIFTFAKRKWRERTMKKRQSTGEKRGEEDEARDGMMGNFNKSILNSIRQFDFGRKTERQNKINGQQSPFVSRESVKLETLEGEETDQEEEGEEGETARKDEEEEREEETMKQNGEEKKKKKPRKKYKDPDPETVEGLKKLTEQGLHGKLATAQLRAKTQLLEEQMSDEEREKERKTRQDQLEAIFRMMETQKEKFGINDKEELVEQMKMYSI